MMRAVAAADPRIAPNTVPPELRRGGYRDEFRREGDRWFPAADATGTADETKPSGE